MAAARGPQQEFALADVSLSAGYSADRPVRVGLVLFALAMGGFSIGTAEFAAMSLLPYFSVTLGINEATASHVISAYALGVVVGAPVLAVMGARMSRRWLLVGLMLAYGVFNILSAMAPTYGMMVLFRFMAGLPHGAYFGVAALLAASLVPARQRTRAVSLLMVGLTVATVVGVPFATVLGQTIGWRWGFGLVGILAATTATLILTYAPRDIPDRSVNPLRELAALGNRQVLLTLATAAVGFGGFFAVYTYVASTLLEVTQAGPASVPLALALMGIGMTLGTLGAGWLADKWPVGAAVMIIGSAGLLMLVYPFATGALATMLPVLFLIGLTACVAPVLQTRLMDVAGDAQTMAAAMNHSAFNAANALGPWLAAMAITAGYGLPAAGFVGAGLSALGLLVYGVTVWDARRSSSKAARPAL